MFLFNTLGLANILDVLPCLFGVAGVMSRSPVARLVEAFQLQRYYVIAVPRLSRLDLPLADMTDPFMLLEESEPLGCCHTFALSGHLSPALPCLANAGIAYTKRVATGATMPAVHRLTWRCLATQFPPVPRLPYPADRCIAGPGLAGTRHACLTLPFRTLPNRNTPIYSTTALPNSDQPSH